MTRTRQFTFNERGLPTLAKRWDGTIPALAEFPELESGHRSRGQLENLIEHLCKKWLVLGTSDPAMPELCTVHWLTKAATELDGRPTSSDSVDRVLRRWDQVGYVLIKPEPMRFVGLSADGLRLGLEELQRLDRRKRKGSTHFDWDSKTPREKRRK